MGTLFVLFLTTACVLPLQKQALNACNLPAQSYTGPISPLAVGINIPADVDIIQNEGQICFREVNGTTVDAPARLVANIYSSGCYSSSCSLTFERNGELQVDLENHRLRFFSRFMVKGYSYAPGGPVCTCTADCGGAGTLEFDITDLPAGTYQVELGTAMLGEIFIPVFGSSECLSNGQ